MNALVTFLADAKVHDTVLITMVITSFLSALPKPPVGRPTWAGAYKMGYDWFVGFWSMKTGQPLPQIHVQTSSQTPNSSTTQDSTYVGAQTPTPLVQPVIQPTVRM